MNGNLDNTPSGYGEAFDASGENTRHQDKRNTVRWIWLRFRKDGWWVKLCIDIDHTLTWTTVQEVSYVINELSISERLPTVFKPVSPPPYLNGGPRDHLSWVIECHDKMLNPGTVADWLEGRLPQPIEDVSAWPAVEQGERKILSHFFAFCASLAPRRSIT